MALLDIELPYGADGVFACSVPTERVLIHHTAPPAVDQLEERVRNCLNSPLDFPALSQAVLPDDRVVIALDDRTPGATRLIQGCWETLASRGVRPEETLIVQPGSAAASGDADPRSDLPSDVRQQVRLIRHDSSDSKSRAYLASSTSGERLYLAREVVEADFVFCVGAIAYDPLLGHRGTSSVLYPGLSTSDAIRRSRGQGHDELGPNDIRGLRQTIDEVGWLLGVQFALQVIPAGRGGVAAVIAGASDAVFQRGKELLADYWAIEIDARPDAVVIAVDEEAGVKGWDAIGAALETARQLVARDGRIVVLSQHKAPLSSGLELIRDSRTPRDALQPLRLATPDDVIAATQVAKALDWAHVYLHSRLEDDLVEGLFMTPLKAADDCQIILAASDGVAFIESAQHAHGSLSVSV